MPTPRFIRASAVLVAAVIVTGGLVDGQSVYAAVDPTGAPTATSAPTAVPTETPAPTAAPTTTSAPTASDGPAATSAAAVPDVPAVPDESGARAAGTPAAPDLTDDMIAVPSTPVTAPHLHAEAAEVEAREAEVIEQTAVEGGGAQQPTQSAQAAPVAVVHRVSVSIATVTTTTADDAATPPDDASVTTAIQQLHDFWWEESGGTVDVRLGGIERTSLSRSTCDPSAVLDSVHTTAFGGAFASYRWAGTDNHLLVLTRETCGSAAFGTVGGGGGEIFSSVGTDTALGVPVLMHEFGHNLGFGHAGAGMCRSSTTVDAPLSDFAHAADTDTSVACPVEEYADFLDIMGYSVSGARPHLSTPQRLRAGFQVDATTLREPGTRQQVTVGALDGAATTAGGRAVQVVDPLSGDTYWVEYRTASGRDATSAEFRGASPRCSSLDTTLVRCALNGDRAVGEVRVLRAMPLFGSSVSTAVVAAGPVKAGDLTRRDTHLDAGESFTSTGGGFTVTVRSTSTSPSGGAVLDVSLAGGTPTGTAPVGDTAGRPAPKQETAATTTALRADRARQTWGSSTTATLTATVAVAGGAKPSGSVAVLDGTTTLATVPIAQDGTAAFRLPASLQPGVHSLRATFAPAGADQAASTSSTVVVTVDKASTSTTLRLDSATQVHASSGRVTATASVDPIAGSAATGTVVFRLDGVAAAEVALTGGSASWVAPASTRAGSHRLVADFTPSAAAALPSTSATQSFSVTKAPSTAAVSLPTAPVSKVLTSRATVTVTVPGVAAPTGTVALKSGSTTIGTATLTAASAGKVTLAVPAFRKPGTYPIVVVYSGTPNVGGSTSKAATLTVR
ncbi:Ig-like domain repeat protein [Frigoribacterium sp. CFBP 13729]|uniref:Ig-like domain repeat protein n=1 Tax=Frigoribacterium sp. CFBP 13729 TaxID=2775293 RepID=UPI00177FEE11|nr:Ig-like domain repeat protein [Frigoribacterium sp. CFBP 13729]